MDTRGIVCRGNGEPPHPLELLDSEDVAAFLFLADLEDAIAYFLFWSGELVSR